MSHDVVWGSLSKSRKEIKFDDKNMESMSKRRSIRHSECSILGISPDIGQSLFESQCLKGLCRQR